MNIPDNYDLWLKHDSQQQEALSRCPVCSCCGEPIQDEYMYIMQGDSFCARCVNEIFRTRTEDYMDSEDYMEV